MIGFIRDPCGTHSNRHLQKLKHSKPSLYFSGFETKMESIFWPQSDMLGTDLDRNFCFIDGDKIEFGQQIKEQNLHFEQSKPRT
jgi:hypothetical protein